VSDDGFGDTLAQALCRSFAVHADGDHRWIVQVPLVHEDGDGLPIFIVEQGDGWAITDDGMTTSHLFFDDFEATEARVARLARIAEGAGATVDDSKRITLHLEAAPTAYDIGDFIQIISQVQGAAKVSTDERDNQRYRTTIRDIVIDRILSPDFDRDWAPPGLEQAGARGSYTAELRLGAGVERDAPDVVLFAAGTTDRANVAALCVHQFRKVYPTFQPLLAFRPGVSSQAILRFQDEVEDDRAVLQVAPGETMTLTGELARRGVPVKASTGEGWTSSN
jgi:hypothetical protein